MLRKRGNTYHIDIQFNGQRIRCSTGTGDKTLATQLHDKLKADLWVKAALNRETFKRTAVEYFKSREQSSSFKDDIRRLKVLDEWCANKMVDEIDKSLIGDIKAGLRERGLKPSTTNRYLSVLSAILNYAVDRGWLQVVPKVKKETEIPQRKEFLTPDEAKALIKKLRLNHQKEFVAFAIATGLRMRNITHLEWSNVDLFGKTLTIHSDQIKTRKTLVIPINKPAMDILKRRYRLCSEGRVFRLANGNPFDRVGQRSFGEAANRAGIRKKVHPHIFRHTFASWHVLNGTSLYELKELGGWSKIESVLIYAHLNVNHLKGIEERTSIKQAFDTLGGVTFL